MAMDGGLGKAQIACDLRAVEQLALSKRDGFHEAAELRKRGDLRQGSQIPFQVGCDIAIPPCGNRLFR